MTLIKQINTDSLGCFINKFLLYIATILKKTIPKKKKGNKKKKKKMRLKPMENGNLKTPP